MKTDESGAEIGATLRCGSQLISALLGSGVFSFRGLTWASLVAYWVRTIGDLHGSEREP